MIRKVFEHEYTFAISTQCLLPLIAKKLKEKSQEHTVASTGFLGKLSGNKIRFYYRYKKLDDEDISLVPGKIPDLTVHHKYAKAVLTPVDDSSSRLTVDFVDDSKIYINLARFVFFPLLSVFSAFLSFSALYEDISLAAACIISLFFAALWLFCTVVFIKDIKSESDDTFPLLKYEIENFIEAVKNSEVSE